MATKKDVVKKEQAGLPAALMEELAGDAGAGTENVDRDDLTIPFIYILQALSPQCNKRDSEYVEGAEQGMLFNTANLRTYSGEDGVDFVPVMYQRTYTEWVPRDAGGGYVGEHGPEIMEQVTRSEKGKDLLPNGNEIVTAGTWYGILLGPDGPEQAVLSMAVTQFKKSRKLMTQLKQFTLEGPEGKRFSPALWYHKIHLTTVPEENDQGSWFGWKTQLNGSVLDLPGGEQLYADAKAMFEGLKSGILRAAPPSAAGKEGDEEIPF